MSQTKPLACEVETDYDSTSLYKLAKGATTHSLSFRLRKADDLDGAPAVSPRALVMAQDLNTEGGAPKPELPDMSVADDLESPLVRASLPRRLAGANITEVLGELDRLGCFSSPRAVGELERDCAVRAVNHFLKFRRFGLL